MRSHFLRPGMTCVIKIPCLVIYDIIHCNQIITCKMKTLWVMFSFRALCSLALSQAQSNSSSSSAGLPPTCAVRLQLHSNKPLILTMSKLLCLESLILRSSCSTSNTTCVCSNQPLGVAIDGCVMSNCTVREQLSMHLNIVLFHC